jgi:hypothetical protein
MGLGGNEAALAYLLSLSAAKRLIDEYGLYRVTTIIEELGKGAETAAAVDRGILISYDDFERGWKRSLE